MNPVKVLFVCFANICRSPMAEHLLRHYVDQSDMQGRVSVASAGTSRDFTGFHMHSCTWNILQDLGIEADDFVSSSVQEEDFSKYDYIVAMDDDNLSDLAQLFGRLDSKIFKMTDLVPELGLPEVPDPIVTHDFETTYTLLSFGCQALLQKIKAEKTAVL